jgi:hypothetical protein
MLMMMTFPSALLATLFSSSSSLFYFIFFLLYYLALFLTKHQHALHCDIKVFVEDMDGSEGAIFLTDEL